jgi:alpha-tubulin suppressor-like RCC1 family protein
MDKQRAKAFALIVVVVSVVYVTSFAYEAYRPRNYQFFDQALIEEVHMGASHTLFVLRDGSLWGVGSNDYLELGHKERHALIAERYEGMRFTSVPVKILEDVVAASAGSGYSFAIGLDGALWGFGRKDHWLGRTEGGKQLVLPMIIIEDVDYAVAGGQHSFYVRDGALWGMGSNLKGRLGITIGANSYVALMGPQRVMDPVSELAIYTGPENTFLVSIEGSLYSFGEGAAGQLGYSLEDGGPGFNHIPTKVMDNVYMAAAGQRHTLILDRDGVVWGTGDNSQGALGLSIEATNEPVRIMEGVTDLAVGFYYSLILTEDGILYGMGQNQCGSLAGRPEESFFTPTALLEQVEAVWAERYQAIVRMADGSYLGFGDNRLGQLGPFAQ